MPRQDASLPLTVGTFGHPHITQVLVLSQDFLASIAPAKYDFAGFCAPHA
jgi:hypothetical protein